MAGTRHQILANVPTWVTPGGTYVAVLSGDLATQAELDAHTGDTSDAHDASAISIADAGNDFTATDVEGALAELQSDNEAHVAAADPHSGYQLESEKDTASGYLGLDASKNATLEDGIFRGVRDNAADPAFRSFVTGDTEPRFEARASGGILLGAGGATAADVVIARAAADRLSLGAGDSFQAGAQIYPGTPALATQTAAGHFGGTGAPNNANGNNGDFYFRSDGGALTTIYHKRAGAWVGVV